MSHFGGFLMAFGLQLGPELKFFAHYYINLRKLCFTYDKFLITKVKFICCRFI